MRSRSLFAFMLVLALAAWSASSFLGAAEEEATTAPAEPEVVIAETPEADATEAAPVADPFLDQSLITLTPVIPLACMCQVGVSCCGDPGVDITCGNNRHCICNAQDDCILLHVHNPKRR